MDIQRLRYFLEVARQKNFSRAAELCHVSQPSLSQQIKKLEEEVDGPLFLRQSSGVTLSPLGEKFLQYAQAIMASVATAQEFIAETHSQACRTIRLGAIPTVAPYLVPGLFATLRNHIPDARFELIEDRTESVIQALREGSLDFAILSPPTSLDATCDHLTLLQDELLLTLPADHPLARTRTLRPAQLAREPLILLEDSHCLAGQTAAYCSTLGLHPRIALRGSQIDTLLRLVENGFGLAFTPRIAVHPNTHPGLVFRRITGQSCHREIRLQWIRQQVLSSTMRLTLKVLAEHWKPQ